MVSSFGCLYQATGVLVSIAYTKEHNDDSRLVVCEVVQDLCQGVDLQILGDCLVTSSIKTVWARTAGLHTRRRNRLFVMSYIVKEKREIFLK